MRTIPAEDAPGDLAFGDAPPAPASAPFGDACESEHEHDPDAREPAYEQNPDAREPAHEQDLHAHEQTFDAGRAAHEPSLDDERPRPRGSEGYVQSLRRKLLDLRTINRLLHFPHAEQGKSYVRVVDEIPEVLHRKLVDGRTLRILPLPATLAEPEPGDETAPADEAEATEVIAPAELAFNMLNGESAHELWAAEWAARLLGIDPSFELPNPGEHTPQRHRDDAIQTLLYPELHQTILANIADVTRSGREEQGIHTLFAAFGFVEWYERLDSDVPRFAPLVLQPLALTRERKPGTYEYAVCALDEQHEINLAFSERLFRDFGFRLPAWEEEDELGDYFARARQAIACQPRWQLHRWVTISNFSFARIAMYHDLDGERWPSGQAPHTHPTFRVLTSDRTHAPVTRWDDENEALHAAADELPTLVLDADTSQVAAVLEAMEPRNLVIQGPPGTGKSQTIANLIATALHAGQRVLFVAEKLAALEVVKARLDRAGLGAFCLELHSHRATRRAVMDALAQRLDVRDRPPSKLEAQQERARALRAALNEHAAALNAQHGSLGYSVHELIWRRERARRQIQGSLPVLEKLRIPGALGMRIEQLDQVRHALTGLAQASQDRDRMFAEDPESVWLILAQPELEEEQLLTRFEAYQAPLARLHAALQHYLGPDAASSLTVRKLVALRALSRELPTYAQLNAGLIEQLDPESADSLREALTLLRRRAGLVQELTRNCRALPAAQAALDQLRAAATILTRAGESMRAQASTSPQMDEGTTLAASEAEAAARVRAGEELTQTGERVAQLAAFAGIVDARARERNDVARPEPARAPQTPVPAPGEDTVIRMALDDPDAALILRDALAALDAAPREVLQVLRSAPATSDEGALAALHALMEEAAALRGRRNAVLARLEPGTDALELRQQGADYALALRRPWWFAWLYSAFWAARRLYARVARTSGRSARQMAEELLEATRMLDAVARFDAREDVKALAGRAFAGLETDFELLVQAGEWARRIRREHAGLHPAARALQHLALYEALAPLDTLLAEAKRLALEPFWALAARAQSAGQPLSTVLAEEREQARTALTVLAGLRQLGLNDQLHVEDLPKLIGQLAELNRTEGELAALTPQLEHLGLGSDLREAHSEELAVALHAFDRTYEQGIPKAIVASLAHPETRIAFAKELGDPLANEERERAALSPFGIGEERWSALGGVVAELMGAVEKALGTRTLLRAQLRYLRELARAYTTFAGGVVEAAWRGALPVDKQVEAFEYLLYHELVERACEEAPALGQRNGRELESMRRQFQNLDRELLRLNAKAIAAGLSRAEVPEGVAAGKKSEWSELALVKHELSKKQRHIPLRQLLRRAPGALRSLKPCFMMSPLTVAQFLPQLPDQFDLVIIDEASQMRPEDALGAVVRAKRAVVVGDSKQLPPTSFFRRLERTDDEDDDDELPDEAIEQESILDLGVASFGGTRDLRWHYRSRHPSLIAFSNQHFYDGRLKVFPAPRLDGSGVQLVKVDGAYAASRNAREAEQIALGVREHVREHSHLTLGVVAMNQQQKELIQQKIYELDDDAVRAFVDAQHPTHPFFVKSLENVQGDERDTIFVSMTYGPDPKTKKVAQRFGPLNSQHGARRLNVLFTRARERLVVYSSLDPEDVRVEEGANRGLRTLRDYLVYAARGELEGATPDAKSETAFEHAVREVLEQAGYQVVPRVGVQGFFIDLGVRTADGRGFACGIECDGPHYHAQRSARDRERLRQEVLESQGWKLVRVWSTDWFRAPEAARDRLLAKVRAHCGRPSEPPSA